MARTTFAAWLDARNLTTRQVAELIGAERGTILAYRCGYRQPGWNMAARLGKLLKKSIAQVRAACMPKEE